MTAETVAQLLQEVPDADIAWLIASGQGVTRDEFMWGDMAEKWIDWLHQPAMLSYKAIGELVGRGDTTIRERYYLVKAFPPDVREEYGTLLSVGHFIKALIYGNGGGNPLEVLAYAVGIAEDRGGRPASIDECVAEFQIKGRLKLPKEAVTAHPFSANGYHDNPTWSWPIWRRLMQIPDPQERYRMEAGLRRYIKRIGK